MSDDWGRNSDGDELRKSLEDMRRVMQENFAQTGQRLRRVLERAGQIWEESAVPRTHRPPTTQEEAYLRVLINRWVAQEPLVARDVGEAADLLAWTESAVWDIVVRTRWEARTIEERTEPYKGQRMATPAPRRSVWAYELPDVPDLETPVERHPLTDQDELQSCLICNGTGRAPCQECGGKGWIVCPQCAGRTRLRCQRCMGRGYVADWAEQPHERKSFWQQQVERFAGQVGDQVTAAADALRKQYGVPIPPLPIGREADPALYGRTVPCPDCLNGEVDCTCGNGKRVCPACHGSKGQPCATCAGTGQIVRHVVLTRQFEVETLVSPIGGQSSVPEARLARAVGETVYTGELGDELTASAPEGVARELWTEALRTAAAAREREDGRRRISRQMIELRRVPITRIDYRYGGEGYTLFAFGARGQEHFYAERFPPLWKRIERFVRGISREFTAPVRSPQENVETGSYRVPVVRIFEEEAEQRRQTEQQEPSASPTDQPDGNGKQS
jgi:hypothetical protein